tara:strand:- start:52 stop:279 length:228 start_codon:yes stop_codon:yes gene_type:complete
MKPGEVAEILLSGGEPLENVPRAVWEHGYEIISLEAYKDDISFDKSGTYQLIFKKPLVLPQAANKITLASNRRTY